MQETQIIIVNELGLHARAAAQLVRLAGKFKSSIKLTRLDNGVVADVKSILSVLTLAATRGTDLKITIEGIDEHEAFEKVTGMISDGFGEL